MISQLEEILALQLRAAKISFEREYRFAAYAVGGPGKTLKKRLNDAGLRDWRFDFKFKNHLAAEVEGGIWKKSRHTTGQGYMQDCEKYNAALELGWRVLRFTDKEIKTGRALALIERVLKQGQSMAP